MSRKETSRAASRRIGIVGGGVIGLSIAWELLRRDFDVVVFEGDRIGGGASRAAAGMLAPTAEVEFWEEKLLDFQRASLESYPEFARELEEVSGIDVDYRTEGTLVVARDRDEDEALERIYDYQNRCGLEVESLDGDEVRQLEPHLEPVMSGLYIPTDHQLDNRRLLRALESAIEARGGEIRESTPIERLGKAPDSILLEGEEERFAVDRVVIAAGAQSGMIEGIPELERPIVQPVRGQALSIELGEPPLCRRVIRCPDVYFAPKSDGRLIMGSTSEEKGFRDEVTAGGLFDILREGWEMMPAIYDQPVVEIWNGFRPESLDGEPVLGASRREGVWLATGHGRHGILLAPATGRLMAEALEKGELPEKWTCFEPSRFAG